MYESQLILYFAPKCPMEFLRASLKLFHKYTHATWFAKVHVIFYYTLWGKFELCFSRKHVGNSIVQLYSIYRNSNGVLWNLIRHFDVKKGICFDSYSEMYQCCIIFNIYSEHHLEHSFLPENTIVFQLRLQDLLFLMLDYNIYKC